MAIDKQPSCDDPVEPALLPVAVALQRLRAEITPLNESITVGLRASLGCVLSEDLQSPIQVPAYTNSAMDGYAINSADLPLQDAEKTLTVVETVFAGNPVHQALKRGEAARIMTGGMMPPGSDTVVIQEHVEVQGNTIRIDATTQSGRNVRQAGEDINSGDIVLPQGTLITPAELGLIASLGMDKVNVFRPLVVAFFSTGDELRALEQHAGQTLQAGEIFDSNRHTLFAMLSRLNVELLDLGVVPDTKEATHKAVLEASQKADVIISSGGVSAGQADFVSKAIEELGDLTFWKLAMRPGRPLASGLVGGARFFGLPGNPVAVMVTFYEFVQPVIKMMMGCLEVEPHTFSVKSSVAIRKVPGRIEYQRGILARDTSNDLCVRTTGKQGAGRLTSMCLANCLIVLPEDCNGIAPGDIVQVQPFTGLV